MVVSRPRILVAWSSGKDSAWALHLLRQSGEYEVAGLLTTYSEVSQRVPQHEVRLRIVELQAAAAGLPLAPLPLPHPCPNTEYEARLHSTLAAAVRRNISAIAYGDLHLADIRAYREALHHGTGVAPLFPLWGRDTRQLAQEMAAGGLRGIVTGLDAARLPAALASSEFGPAFLAALPPGVDHCGEHGEFHTCVTAGPMLSEPLRVARGTQERRGEYIYTDLLPVSPNGHHVPLLELAE
jgi:uncharacterized protein (TIGR00290 family)